MGFPPFAPSSSSSASSMWNAHKSSHKEISIALAHIHTQIVPAESRHGSRLLTPWNNRWWTKMLVDLKGFYSSNYIVHEVCIQHGKPEWGYTAYGNQSDSWIGTYGCIRHTAIHTDIRFHDAYYYISPFKYEYKHKTNKNRTKHNAQFVCTICVHIKLSWCYKYWRFTVLASWT